MRLEVIGGFPQMALPISEGLESLDLDDHEVQRELIETIESARLLIVTADAIDARLERSYLEALWRAELPPGLGPDGPPEPPEISS
jgi:hypothetical protein